VKQPTVEPANATPDEVLSAVESTLKAHDLRLKPGQTLDEVVAALKGYGVTLTAERGYLSAEMNGQAAHINKLFEGLADKEAARFFPRDPSGVSSRSELDTKAKLEYIAKQGLEAWERLPQTAPPKPVVLDARRITKAEYLSLDRATRSELAGRWGAETIGQILGRK